MRGYSDKWVIADIAWELRDALKLGRKPIIFVNSGEEDRIKRLLPIARERFEKDLEEKRIK